jgi:hypothetical protein
MNIPWREHVLVRNARLDGLMELVLKDLGGCNEKERRFGRSEREAVVGGGGLGRN